MIKVRFWPLVLKENLSALVLIYAGTWEPGMLKLHQPWDDESLHDNNKTIESSDRSLDKLQKVPN
jgi:hypothetical protein